MVRFSNEAFGLTMFSACFSVRSTQIKTYSWDNAQVALVGNKQDLGESERVVKEERGQQLAKQLGERLSIPLHFLDCLFSNFGIKRIHSS